MPDPIRIIPLAFGGFGLLFLLVGLGMLRYLVVFRRRAVRCRGVVVDHVRGFSGEGSTIHYPVLEFRTADGRDVRTESNVGTSWRRHQPGQEVLISYDPRRPERAYLGRGAFPLVVLVAVFTGFGVLFGGLGLIFLLVGL